MSEGKGLPAGWRWVKLGDVCERITKGGTPTTYGFKFQRNGVRFLKIENVKEGRVILDSITDFISEEAHEYQKKSQLSVGDILFSIAGTIGETCAVMEEYLPANTNQAFAIIRGAQDHFNLKFLQFQLELFVAKIKIKARGGAMNNVSLEDLKNFETILPPKGVQNIILSKIEELLSAIDKGKQQLETAQQQLKIYRQAVLKWAFEGKLTNKNVKDGELPTGWKWVKLGEVAKKQTLKVLPNDYPDAKFIGMDCIEAHTIRPYFTYKFSEFKSAGNFFKANQVLYGRMRPYLNKVYRAEYDGACSGEFIILQCVENFNPDLLKFILHSRGFVSFANHLTSGDRPRISYEEISDYPIAFPTSEEQALIVQEIESRLSVCDKLEETITISLAQGDTLRQSILKKAFEGKLLN